MEPASDIDLIDKAGKISGGLDLKVLHEALGLGAVVGIAAPAHGTDETMFGEYVDGRARAMRTSGFGYDAVKIFCDKNGRMTKVEPQSPEEWRDALDAVVSLLLALVPVQSATKTRPFLIFSLV
jgi:hypothetical protein